jgi:hypothetical protein
MGEKDELGDTPRLVSDGIHERAHSAGSQGPSLNPLDHPAYGENATTFATEELYLPYRTVKKPAYIDNFYSYYLDCDGKEKKLENLQFLYMQTALYPWLGKKADPARIAVTMELHFGDNKSKVDPEFLLTLFVEGRKSGWASSDYNVAEIGEAAYARKEAKNMCESLGIIEPGIEDKLVEVFSRIKIFAGENPHARPGRLVKEFVDLMNSTFGKPVVSERTPGYSHLQTVPIKITDGIKQV